jgi:hypothetical protein
VLCLHLPHHLARRVRSQLVLDEVAELGSGSVVRAHRLVQARGVRHRPHREPYLVDGPSEAPGNLLLGGFPLELGRELVVGARDLPYLLGHVHGDPYGPALVRYSPLHRLPYPPRSISREPEAPIGIELLNGLHQPYVTLLDKVLEGQSVAAVLLGDADDEPQVLLYKPLPGPLVALLGALGEIYLLLVREELSPAYVCQVLRQKLRRLVVPRCPGVLRTFL